MSSTSLPAIQPVAGQDEAVETSSSALVPVKRRTSNVRSERFFFRKHIALKAEPQAHHLVHKLYEIMNAQCCTQLTLAKRVGMSRDRFFEWKKGHAPVLSILEDCYQVLGYELYARPLRASQRKVTFNSAHVTGYRPVEIPKAASPIVKVLYEKMNEHKCGRRELERLTGVSRANFTNWQRRSAPSIDRLETCLSVFGLEIAIRPIKDDI